MSGSDYTHRAKSRSKGRSNSKPRITVPRSKIPFREQVYSLTRQIPLGKVSTYGLIAKAIGNPKGSRAVGMVLRANPNPIVTPCHRVVRSDGRIGGYMGGVEKKVRLLTSEGIDMHERRIQNLEKFLFSGFGPP